MSGKDLFLLGVFRRRLEYPALKRAVREQQRLFGATVVLIEDKASGTQLIQELITDGCHGVTRYQPTGDKTMRLHAQTAIIENGFVHIPETAPWLAEYLHEMAVFPKGKHDDQADSTAQFLEWFKTPIPGWGILEYYRRRAEELEQRRKPPPVTRIEELRAAWLDTSDLEQQKRICVDLQKQLWDDVPFIPMGEYWQATAYRKDLADVLPGCFATFYGVRRT